MSYTKDVVVYPELRPPVASVDGQSPLRGSRLKKVFKVHEKQARKDPALAKATAMMIVQRYTDDGQLIPKEWDKRHDWSPTKFNDKNHTHYKQFFDKKYK